MKIKESWCLLIQEIYFDVTRFSTPLLQIINHINFFNNNIHFIKNKKPEYQVHENH